MNPFGEIIEKARNEPHVCECCQLEPSTFIYLIEKSIMTSYFHICFSCSKDPFNCEVDYNYRLITKFA